MDNTELFVYSEEEHDETPKQSPQSNQTWPMDKIRRSRYQLPSPVTPKRSYSISQSKSLLLQCLRDYKTDPIPRSKRFLASSCSDEGILMDGVLVTSATTTAKKKPSDSPSSSLVRSSAHSSIIKDLHKNSEFSIPRNKSGRNQTATNPSKLKATAEPFTFTPRSLQRRPVSTLPRNNPGASSYGYPRPLHRPPRLYIPPHASPHMPYLHETHYLAKLPSPTGYQMRHGFNHSQNRISLLPTTPPSSHTSEPFVSRLHSSPSLDGLDTVTTQKLDSSLLSSAGFGTMKTKKEWSPFDDGLETFSQEQTDFVKEHNRILPDSAFKRYKYRKRLSIFTQVCFDDKLLQT